MHAHSRQRVSRMLQERFYRFSPFRTSLINELQPYYILPHSMYTCSLQCCAIKLASAHAIPIYVAAPTLHSQSPHQDRRCDAGSNYVLCSSLWHCFWSTTVHAHFIRIANKEIQTPLHLLWKCTRLRTDLMHPVCLRVKFDRRPEVVSVF